MTELAQIIPFIIKICIVYAFSFAAGLTLGIGLGLKIREIRIREVVPCEGREEVVWPPGQACRQKDAESSR